MVDHNPISVAARIGLQETDLGSRTAAVHWLLWCAIIDLGKAKSPCSPWDGVGRSGRLLGIRSTLVLLRSYDKEGMSYIRPRF